VNLTISRRGGVVALTLMAVALAATPAVAVLCHPDPPGTRTLVVHGSVIGYDMTGTRVAVDFRDGSACMRTVQWAVLRAPRRLVVGAKRAPACDRTIYPASSTVAVPAETPESTVATDGGRRVVVSGTSVEVTDASGTPLRRFQRGSRLPAQKIALSGRRLVVLVRGSTVPDRPDRVEAYDVVSGRLLAIRPLFSRAVTLDLFGDVVLYGDADRGGLYALRLHDGRTTVIGPTQRHDMPQIERPGVVYQDDMLKKLDGRGRVTMKFIPTAAIRGYFRNTGDTLAIRGSISSIAFDGRRIAFALREGDSACAEIKVWDIPWRNDIANASEDDNGRTCPDHHGKGGVAGVALGGLTAEWATNYGGYTRVGATNTRNCVMRRIGGVREPGHDAVRSVSGDRALLVIAASRGSRGHLEFVDPYRLHLRKAIWTQYAPRQASADSHRVAILRRSGTKVDLYDDQGGFIETLAVVGARAISLRGTQLAVLTRARHLDVYDTETGVLRYARRLPSSAAPTIDLHYGIAVYTVGQRVYAMRVADGHATLLARAPASTRAQIDDAGVVYRYNTGGLGVVRFVAMTDVDGRLAGRRASR
jgi:hypothetical protein